MTISWGLRSYPTITFDSEDDVLVVKVRTLKLLLGTAVWAGVLLLVGCADPASTPEYGPASLRAVPPEYYSRRPPRQSVVPRTPSRETPERGHLVRSQARSAREARGPDHSPPRTEDPPEILDEVEARIIELGDNINELRQRLNTAR